MTAVPVVVSSANGPDVAKQSPDQLIPAGLPLFEGFVREIKGFKIVSRQYAPFIEHAFDQVETILEYR